MLVVNCVTIPIFKNYILNKFKIVTGKKLTFLLLKINTQLIY